ncbi:MAG: large conductance mechanosensitive channel protein MscL [Dehalococcoidia bacterium]
MNHPIIKEFRDFIMRGDIIALAVAFIMAIAFKDVVDAVTNGVIMNFIAAIVGKPNFDSIGIDIGDSRLLIGTVLTALVNLVLVGAAVFFFIVKPVKILQERKKEAGEPVPEAEDVVLLREIRDLLKNR